MWRRLRAPVAGGAVVLCALAIGSSAGASGGSDRAATGSHPNISLATMTRAQRAKVSPHLAFARPGARFHTRAGSTGNPADCPWLNTSLPIKQRVSLLMSKMTLADKLDLMEGHNGDAPNGAIGDTHAIPALCIPEVTQQDGPAGVADGVPGATQLPAPVNDAATWSRTAARNYGKVLGNEEWTKGNMVVYGPTINIQRDPRWGRNFEALSEDPFLTGTLGSSIIKGIQSQGPIAQVKHYAVYNVETNRNTTADDDVIDARTLHEIYLPAFYDTTIKAGAGSVMCSYASPNGTFACQNQSLLSILEQHWGFKGWVGSDYGAVHQAVPAVNAGLDQEQGSQLFEPALEPAALDGEIPMSTIDAAAERVLFEMFKHGFFNNQPTGTESTNASTPAHVAFAQKNSEEGTVLLKNSGSILPLSSSQTKSIAVIGADGTTDPETVGGGSAGVNPTGTVVSPLAGITARAGSGVTVTSYSGTTPADAATTAAGAQVAIVFANNFESEGSDLQNITLQNNQDALIQAVADANPHTIVVLNTGGPVTMPWLSSVQGVLEAWYPGQQDGAAIASILFGDTNPSGHLPETFPASLAQAPTSDPARFPGTNGMVQYSDALEVGYRYYDTENVTPLFPFGFGLSYTSFKYSNLKLSTKHVTNTTSGPDAGQGTTEQTVTATVTNTGTRTGADVAQLYVGDPASTGEPVRQLEGFRRVKLTPGRSKTITFSLTGHELSFYDPTANGWVLPTGDFTAYVGDSSALSDLPLQGSFTVTKSVGARTEALNVPATAGPESTFTATATFDNAGDFPLTGASSKLALPAGWSAAPQSAFPAKVRAHQTVSQSWTVTVPASAQGTSPTLTASVSGSTARGKLTKVADDAQQVKVDPVIEATAPASQILDPGQSTTVSVALANRLPRSVTATVTPQAPNGVTFEPSSDKVTIPGDGAATATFTVSATAAGSGNQTIPLAITASAGSSTFSVAPTPASDISLNVAFTSLAAAFNNIGISDESAPFTSASFDTSNQSFSEQQLTAAGFGPGAMFTHDGIPYTWPNVAAGSPDNVIGDGQVIQMSGQGSMLGVLGASNNGNASGPVTVVYTDGTETTGQVTLNDWFSNAEPAPGDILVTTPNWDHSPSQGPHAVSVYAQSIPIDPTKTVADVILPSSSNEAATNDAPFHVFALGIGTPGV